MPLAIAEAASEVASLARAIAEGGNPRVAGDAIAGAELAAAVGARRPRRSSRSISTGPTTPGSSGPGCGCQRAVARAADTLPRRGEDDLPSSLEIAQAATLRPIPTSPPEIGLEPDEVELYGRYKAKVSLGVLDRLADRPDGKLIDVTAITPTPAGEGKTTTSVSLTQGFGKLGKQPVLCLREASLGPVFGIKGGAAGGGYAQVVPMEDMNLHFTGDIHAIGAANNLLAAMVDAHLLHGNKLGIDPLSISLAALRRHQRPRAPRHRRWPRRPRERLSAPDRLRHHRRVRGDGDRRRRARPPRPAAAPRRDHGRPDVRGRAGHCRAAEGRRRDDGAAQGHDQAQPRPDARGRAGLRPLRAVREYRARQQLARRRPCGAEARRLRRHRERVRLGHGHGEVLRHRLPRRAACGRARPFSSRP